MSMRFLSLFFLHSFQFYSDKTEENIGFVKQMDDTAPSNLVVLNDSNNKKIKKKYFEMNTITKKGASKMPNIFSNPARLYNRRKKNYCKCNVITSCVTK